MGGLRDSIGLRARQMVRRVPGMRKLWRAWKSCPTLAQPRSLRPTPTAGRCLWEAAAYTVARDCPKILHAVGSLSPGGAERQLCNSLVSLDDKGWDASLLHFYEMSGECGHYLPLLLQSRVKLHPLARPGSSVASTQLSSLSDGLLPHLAELHQTLTLLRPAILHAWLDYTNILAGVAALLAGVPTVVLSTRNVNPGHFPYFHQPWFLPWYRLLAAHPRVHWINNSEAGAADYARWIGMPVERFHVIRNGVDPASIRRPDPQTCADFRRRHGIPAAAPLVAGVFRLSEEKQPETFVEVMLRVLRAKPDTYAVIAGVGPLDEVVRRAIERAGAAERILLLGRRADVPVIVSAADVLLLTSRAEGTPNVLLEAQLLGRPVVATRAGGASEALADGQTGRLLEVGDVAGLSAAVLELLRSPDLRARYGQAGPDFIRQRFGLERMVHETTQLYQQALRSEMATLAVRRT